MALDNLNEKDRNCLEGKAKVPSETFHEEAADKNKYDLKNHRVRFEDDEGITERFVSTDEVDAAPKVKKVHILKNKSSSETSILLRTSSLTKPKFLRPVSIDSGHYRAGDNLNNNTLRENLNGGILKTSITDEDDRKIDEVESHNNEVNTKDVELSTFKKNCNVYSVYQAKTILSERKKSLPLSNIPKLIGHRVNENGLKSPTALDSSNENISYNKDFTTKAIGKISRGIGRLLRRSNSVKISEPDPVYKVAYLGNVLTGWARGDNCVEKPLATLWRNYNQSTKPDVVMKLSITNSGLKGTTKEHGLTEYWSHRITYCASLPHYPKIFCWIYRHEGRKLKHELRCHAVLCSKELVAKSIREELQVKLKQALAEFKKEKISRQNARLSLANSVYDNPSMPRRKILLSIGATNYRPPLERSKSAPKLGAIEELCSEEEEEAEYDKSEKLGKAYVSLGIRNQDCINSWRWRKSEKISPRKHSLPDSIGSEIFRKVDADKINDLSFSDELFNLLERQLKPFDAKPTQIDTNNDVKIVEHPKKFECNRSMLRSIDETTELADSTSPYLVRETKVLEMLGQNNFVIDSDDGSVSSGCETASTATSSDNEHSSLPPNNHGDFVKLEHSQTVYRNSFEEMRSDCEYRRHLPPTSNCRSVSDVQNDSILTSKLIDIVNCDSEANLGRIPSEEVNTVPIGEKNTFQRRSTYPPLKNLQGIYTEHINQFDTLIDNLSEYELLGSSGDNDDVFKSSGDNVSACSDESGYSELLDNGKESSIASTIMV